MNASTRYGRKLNNIQVLVGDVLGLATITGALDDLKALRPI